MVIPFEVTARQVDVLIISAMYFWQRFLIHQRLWEATKAHDVAAFDDIPIKEKIVVERPSIFEVIVGHIETH